MNIRVFIFSIAFVSINTMKGWLLYENLEPDLCKSMSCFNFLTLKKPVFDQEKSMKDFTICFRLKLLRYRGKNKWHTIMRAKTDKFVNNPDWNRLWPTGFHFDLNPRDSTANGVITIQTFNENVTEVLRRNGSYAIWPIYNEHINANEWNSFCFGSNLATNSIFLVKNGVTVHNFSQPIFWTKVNIGLYIIE